MIDADDDRIGFFATDADAIDYTDPPDRFTRNRPAHGGIPASYVSTVGVDSHFMGTAMVAISWLLASSASP